MPFTGAAVVRAGARGASGQLRLAAWAGAGGTSPSRCECLLARGAVNVPIDLAGGLDDTYSRLDLAIYSPLCLALGGGTVPLLRRASVSSAVRIETSSRAEVCS